MRSRRRLLLGFLTAVLGASPAPAAASSEAPPEEYSHRVWRIQDGLPQNKVQAVSQTPDGYLWIGTSGGLVRFDGVRFVVFDRSNTAAFRDDSILALCPARDGSLWIGTEGGGLLHFRNGAFQAYGENQGLTNGFVRAVKEDRLGALWVGTDRGFFRFEAGRLARLDGQAGLPVLSVLGIAEGRDGRLWVGGFPELMVVEEGALHPYRHGDELPAVPAGSVWETRNGVLWLGTAAGLRQLKDGRISPALGSAAIRALCEDREGSLWVGTVAQGLIRLRAGVPTTYRAPGMLPDNTIRSVFEDREGNLWVGTQDGLARLSKKTVSTLTSRDGLSDDNVSTVYEDRGGTLWMTTINGQLYRRAGHRAVPFQLPSPADKFRASTVFRDSKGDLWIGSEGHGIVRLSEGRVACYTKKDGLRSSSVRSFHEDRQGNIWVATGSGLSRWDGRAFRTFYIEDGLAYGSVRVIADGHGGDLLAGTDGGVNRIHDGKIVRDPVLAQLGSERVWTILEDSDGGLWLGTRGGGLFRVKQGKVTRYTTRDGLLSNSIYQLLEDRNDRFWMSSPAGISSVDRKELDAMADGKPGPVAVVPYGTAEGLESSQMNGGVQSAGCRTAAGELWFPSVKGAVRIDPNQLRASPPAPVLIETMRVDDRPIELSGEVRIPAGRGKLEIQYTACSLLSPDRIGFQFKLEGFDKEWTAASTRRVAYYTNLPPGRYRFRVAAGDVAAPREVSEAAVAFRWEPRFHETGWFYGLCALLAGACGWTGLRFYTQMTRARYTALLVERTRLAREMHDTVIQGCVGVSTLLEAASSSQQPTADKRRELLDQARIQLRLTLDEARQAVWDLRHSSLGSGVARTLSSFARQLSLEKGIPVQTEIAGQATTLDDRTDRHLLLVAREAIRNAVTHADPRQIDIRLCFELDEVRLEVTDDGRGFVPAAGGPAENGHYGIVGMRERIEQLGGSFLLRSSPGQGTRIVARVPLPGHRLRQEPASGDHD